MAKVAIVAGGGSGVGRAVAQRLAREGWSVAALGRTEKTLNETASEGTGRIVPIVCDIADEKQVAEMVARVQRELGTCEALVNSAGENIKKRSLEELSVADFERVMNVNLRGAFLLAHAVLPGMRKNGRGTIVNVISDAGIWANRISGAAYIASKFGLNGLTSTINAEERSKGIRACGVFPGEIDTPLLLKRAVMPSEEAREKMLKAEDVAECVMLAINLPERALVEMIVVRPTILR